MPKKILRKRKLLSRDRSAHTAKRMCRASKSRNSRNCRLETESMKCQKKKKTFFFNVIALHTRRSVCVGPVSRGIHGIADLKRNP